VALAPRQDQRARCLFNRALAYTSLADLSGKGPPPVKPAQDPDSPLARALADYTWALDLDPGLGAAALNRGVLRYRARQYAEATADLRLALDRGADPVLVHYNLALVYRAAGDPRAALASARVVLQRDPSHQGARALLTELQR
jgi:tetratricopeptide (TPR) repeat protein